MDITIKKTTEYEKGLDIAKGLPDFFTQQGLDEIKQHFPEQTVYGAFDGEQLVGCASYKKINDATLELAFLFVAGAYHGQGIGTKLVRESLASEAADFKVCQVKTLAETAEDAGYAMTRKFYEKIGFIPIQIVDPYPGWGSENPCQIYVKFLQ